MENTEQQHESTPLVSPKSAISSEKFLQQWQTLVSTTNWQKGEIIVKWRAAPIKNDVPSSEYSDEAWSEIVGDVSAQHVGRLRRVYERFHEVWRSYEGLYWTHFLVAIDWEDAEMWLEGALQNGWSVSQLRRQRWETLGSIEEDLPQDTDIVSDEFTIDASLEAVPSDIVVEHLETIGGADAGTTKKSKGAAPATHERKRFDDVDRLLSYDPLSSLDEPPTIDDLPGEFSRSLDQFASVIRKHKQTGWMELSQDVVLATLDSLRMLVLDEFTDDLADE